MTLNTHTLKVRKALCEFLLMDSVSDAVHHVILLKVTSVVCIVLFVIF